MKANAPSQRAPRLRRRSHGLTLLETLVYLSIWALLSIATVRALGEARMIRSGAKDRAQMAWMAQEILDERRVAGTSHDAGTFERLDLSERLAGTEAVFTVEEGPSGTLLLEVVVRRESLEGKPTVRLTTLVAGGLGQ